MDFWVTLRVSGLCVTVKFSITCVLRPVFTQVISNYPRILCDVCICWNWYYTEHWCLCVCVCVLSSAFTMFYAEMQFWMCAYASSKKIINFDLVVLCLGIPMWDRIRVNVGKAIIINGIMMTRFFSVWFLCVFK